MAARKPMTVDEIVDLNDETIDVCLGKVSIPRSMIHFYRQGQDRYVCRDNDNNFFLVNKDGSECKSITEDEGMVTGQRHVDWMEYCQSLDPPQSISYSHWNKRLEERLSEERNRKARSKGGAVMRAVEDAVERAQRRVLSKKFTQ